MSTFRHSDALWADFPQLVPGVLHVESFREAYDLTEYLETAERRLDGTTETQLPEIQAWRRAYTQLGLKPTQYRCASEALLRRFRKEKVLPRIHPVIDLCNAVSMAYAIPVAVLDLARISGDLEVRYATGDEEYLTFGGEIENPQPGEVVFADDAGQAHARRWTNRQSGLSAVREGTETVLIVAEALHETAAEDVKSLVSTLEKELAHPRAAILDRASPEFTV
ncbi:B3/4 domain-containing protein [Amycolatopsis sp. YIM 10]|uniref:B3/B4 domain-containing protein n=1 Tax=Amycolatopsis sp. YIM 10 TaxID=2653857 RepID=UPI0012908391|nr:phenylalanine--tRNA ligase beta subunit-related protein [Amycolatopsis sp. YIM 10]QFU86464.1 B3/4 domain protein [Amycolatopsis sp. YIM 10]